MSVAWLITHDTHIDRRIFFYADVFKDMGYEVQLFSSYRPDEMEFNDLEYVRRPEDILLIKDLKKSCYTALEYVSDVQIKETFKNAIITQETFLQNNGRYAVNKEELSNAGFYCERDYNVQSIKDIYYNISVLQNGNSCYIYNNIANGLRLVEQVDANREFCEIESAIYDYKKSKAFDECEFKYEGKNGIRVTAQNNGYVFLKDLYGVRYEYNTETDKIIKIIRIESSPVAEDDLLGKHYDFIDFRKIIFDYSPILSRIKKDIEEGRELPKIVYVADLPTLPIGYMIKDVLNCVLIVDCHEWWKEQSILWEPQSKKKINLIDKYEKQLYLKSDLLITVGRFLADKMTNYFNKEFYPIYSCMVESNMSYAEKNKSFWSSKLGLPENARVAVFQGSLTTLRNLDNLARATYYLDEMCYLVLIGDGPYRQDFEKIVHKEGNPSRVVYTGWVNQESLLEYTIQADLGILPYKSLNDYYSLCVPNKFIEYYTSRVPILCDESLCEISYIVKTDGIGICVDCSDPKKLGETTNSILNDAAIQNKIRSCYSNINNNFSFEIQKINFLEICKRLVR